MADALIELLNAPDSALVARVSPSPNFGERRAPYRPNILILHYTGMPTGEGALRWLCDPVSQVSCHYVIEEDGSVIQLVAEERRAWHAGAGVWKGERDINSASIGIEIVNPGHDGGCPPFPEPQIEATVALCRDICARRFIAPQRVLAHSDIAPKRKRDPGERFPWDRLHRAGIGHWTPPAPIRDEALMAPGEEGPSVRALQAMLALYGYGIEMTGVNDAQTKTVVAAFQRHFRSERVDGIVDSSTVETLRRLLTTLAPA